MRTRLRVGLLFGVLATVNPIMAQSGGRTPPQVTPPTTRPAPPTRDPNTPGFVTAKDGNAGHVDRSVKQQTLPEALEWLWRGYAIEGSKSAP